MESFINDFLPLIGTIIIVSGALQIILFFKIWKMTDDIKIIKDKYTIPRGVMLSEFDIKKQIVLGEKENIKDYFIGDFFNNIRISQFEYHINDIFKEEKKNLEENLKKIECEMPEGLKNLNSYSDFEKLYE